VRRASLVLAGLLVAIAMPAAAQQARSASFDKLPYWPGYWVNETAAGTPISGIPDPTRRVAPDAAKNSLALWGTGAPWNEEGKRRVAEAQRTMNARKGLGWGYPLMMMAPTPLQVLITPEEVLIDNAYNETRHIYTDGRKMPATEDMWPTVTGTSIGHWEGQVLVIDTVQVTNPNTYFQGAPPLSEQAAYHDRIWLDGDKLRAHVTVEDPVTLTGPWSVDLSWVRDPGFDRMIQVDWTNDRTGSDGQVNTIEPPADERGHQ
jgi:hypothetical protein